MKNMTQKIIGSTVLALALLGAAAQASEESKSLPSKNKQTQGVSLSTKSVSYTHLTLPTICSV